MHPDRKTVSVKNLENGEIFEENYDKLILSPGAKPTQPRLPGVGMDKLFTLRTDVYKRQGLYHWHKSGVHYVITLYKADKFTGELKSSEEGRAYWIPLEELKTKELATGMEHVLRILESEKEMCIRDRYMDFRRIRHYRLLCQYSASFLLKMKWKLYW